MATSGSETPADAPPAMKERLAALLDPRRFPPGKRVRFFIYLAAGMAATLALRGVARTAWGEGNLNAAFDYFIRDEARAAVRAPAPADRVAFIDVDHETYKSWGDPLFTPRDRIARMIRAAVAGRAAAVLLDVLLEYPDYDPATDAELRRALEETARSTAPTRIVFPVRLDMRGRLRRNLHDDLIDAHPDRFLRGLPSLSATPEDRVVRHWKLYGRYRPEAGEGWRVIWGTPFLGAALAAGALDDLRRLEPRLLARNARDGELVSLPVAGGRALRLSGRPTDYYLQRIRFRLIPPGVMPERPEGNVRPIRPREVDALLASPEAARAFFEGRVVVVGVSNPECGDIHPTPLGDMAGLYIMGNSVDTVLSGEQPVPSPAWLELSLEAFAVVACAYAFVHLPGVVAQLALSALLFTALGGVSLWYFRRHAVLLNFVFSILAMQGIAALREIEEIVTARLRKRRPRPAASSDPAPPAPPPSASSPPRDAAPPAA